ncbi:hypothetical protein ABID22_002583 [Pontibacter aydingkolensis]|uniref:Lipoprotein n=1 Tax=Pontibacter aydingkolensis TaxID=1911536 RepID=A0ABS7CW88_9BACT|nr:hypothetical protein [Pontibacter aydingkolensis]MBW7468085.1 hypothetical protein [Pontibacter aydingkolensis]
MKTHVIKLLLVLVGIALTGCPSPLCLNPNPSYSFAVTAHFTPERDSIRVGDTLYLVSEFPNFLVPIGEQDAVDYSKSTAIGNTLGLLRLESVKSTSGAVSSFDYINVWGRIYNSTDIPSPERMQQLRYEENDGKYKLRVGLIPKKPGIYLMGIGSGLSKGRMNDKCVKASFQTILTNENSNLNYYEQWFGSPMDQSATKISFLIKVY